MIYDSTDAWMNAQRWCWLCRCATAFNVTAICLVGSRHFNTFGSHGSDAFVNMKHFGTLEECCETLKEKHGEAFMSYYVCVCC